MTKGLRVVKENSNLAEWTRQVEECRNSGMSIREWCEQKGIAQSTYMYRQPKVWKALNQQSRNAFIEMLLTVHASSVRAEIHNGADEVTLTVPLRALKSS